jgi:Uma2 family endonuclease
MVTREIIAVKNPSQPNHSPTLPDTPILPSLENGDRLTRYEFERRYAAMPHLKKAELINGVVFIPSPVHNTHSELHGLMMTWLGVYTAATTGVRLNDNATLRLDADNEVQPDALLRLEPTLGGRCQVTEDDYLEGPPELIVEIAASSAAYDLHDKLQVYRRSGVSEYLVWQVYDQQFTWFQWREGQYVSFEADAAGIIRSQIFPGLHLLVTALLEGNLAEVLAELQRGLATEAHLNFLNQLANRKESTG